MPYSGVVLCVHCQESFVPVNPNQRYCHPRCRVRAWNVRHPRVASARACVTCGESCGTRYRYCEACGRARRVVYQQRYVEKLPQRPCKECGKMTHNRSYCSRSCESVYKAARRPPSGRVCPDCGQRFRRRGLANVCALCGDLRKAEARAESVRIRGELRIARLVKVTVRDLCGCGNLKPARRLRCDGPGPHTRPRICSSCRVEWRPTDRPSSKASSKCWECRRPRSDGLVYSHVREHLKKRLVLREGGCCQDCAAAREDVGEPLHAHHVQPQALGGPNVLENLRLLCPDCHVGSGWMRHHFALVEAGLVHPPMAHQAPQLALVA